MSRIVIVGGGSAGIMSAARLRNTLSMSEAEITIIDPSDKHIYQPAFTLIAFGLDEPENVVRPMSSVIPAGCTFINDEVASINYDDQQVETKGGRKLEYDYLILATGATYNWDEIEGLKDNLGKDGVHTFYTLEGAIAVKKAIEEFEGGDFTVVQPPMPFKCPGAPIKMTLMAEDYFRRKGIRNKTNVTLTTALPSVFSREPYATKLNEIVEARNINVVPGFNPGKVDVENKIVKSWEGKEVKYDLAVVIPHNEGEGIHEDTPVADPSNFIKADKHKLVSEAYDNVYAVGDCANYPTSKTGAGARKQAEVLATNLAARIRGQEGKAYYTGHII
ncbi:MAG: NAD(P)/FAD-dependent oxidoreductase [Firmicutes bacterium]|nr:NAD(P)/FAD-dependent oxidoreductase [Bacillota bacterium]